MGKAHRGEFHVVRLSGFVHTDDKLAVKEIWQQLGKELEGGEDDHVGKVGFLPGGLCVAYRSGPDEQSRATTTPIPWPTCCLSCPIRPTSPRGARME